VVEGLVRVPLDDPLLDALEALREIDEDRSGGRPDTADEEVGFGMRHLVDVVQAMGELTARGEPLERDAIREEMFRLSDGRSILDIEWFCRVAERFEADGDIMNAVALARAAAWIGQQACVERPATEPFHGLGGNALLGDVECDLESGAWFTPRDRAIVLKPS